MHIAPGGSSRLTVPLEKRNLAKYSINYMCRSKLEGRDQMPKIYALSDDRFVPNVVVSDGLVTRRLRGYRVAKLSPWIKVFISASFVCPVNSEAEDGQDVHLPEETNMKMQPQTPLPSSIGTCLAFVTYQARKASFLNPANRYAQKPHKHP